MKTVEEIRAEAFRVINKVITLKVNVNNGCYSDAEALAVEEKRLAAIKTWAAENGQLMTIRNYFACHNFGGLCQFVASDIAKFFNE